MCSVEWYHFYWYWTTLIAETVSTFCYRFESSYFRKYATDLLEIFRTDSLMDTDRSPALLWQPSYVYSTGTSFSPQWPIALDRRKCNTRGRPRRFLLTTPVHRGTDIDPLGTDISPGSFSPSGITDTRVRRDTTRSASAALDAREPTNWPINNN